MTSSLAIADVHAEPWRPNRCEVCVWRVPLDAGGVEAAEATALLSKDERARAWQYRFEDRRRMFIMTRAALRLILGRETGDSPDALRLGYSAGGKPSLAGGHREVRFNVSHSGNIALVAVSVGCEVGVDVERLRPVSDAMGIARRFFVPGEAALLARVPVDQRDRAFLSLWTRKEACLKACGRGLLTSPALVDVSTPPTARFLGGASGGNGGLSSRACFRDAYVGDAYAAAVAAETEVLSFVVREFDFRSERLTRG